MQEPVTDEPGDLVIDLVAAERSEAGDPAELLALHDELWKSVNALDALWAEVERQTMQGSTRSLTAQGVRSTLDVFAAARNLSAQINEARRALVRARDFIDMSWEAAEALAGTRAVEVTTQP